MAVAMDPAPGHRAPRLALTSPRCDVGTSPSHILSQGKEELARGSLKEPPIEGRKEVSKGERNSGALVMVGRRLGTGEGRGRKNKNLLSFLDH